MTARIAVLAAASALLAAPQFSSRLHAGTPTEAETLSVYAKPSRAVRLPSGRRINVYCSGAGFPTVILTAGLGYWSFDWHKVQPAVARFSRVCSWDRAGFGFSDSSRRSVTPVTSERDLEDWIRASGLKPPFVMVGHSIGGIETRLFTARNPTLVAAMVLLDPSVADQNESMKRIAPKLAVLVDSDEQTRACWRASLRGRLAPKKRDQCAEPVPVDAPPSLRAIWYRLAERPSGFAADLSMDHGLTAAARELRRLEKPLSDKPVIVLTAGKHPPVPAGLESQADAWARVWRADHQRIAALSRHGVERVVPTSTHVIEQEAPDAAIEAIRQAADEAR